MKLYKVIFNDEEELGMKNISLVEDPAVEVDFVAFESEKVEFSKIDEEKREITGVVAVADMPIIRKNEQLGVHYIMFEKETIKQMVLKYFKDGKVNNIDLDHSGNMVDGITMIESYIKDSSRNIAPIEFSDVADGSWIATFKVENDEVWDRIKKDHSLKGFSLSGIFAFTEVMEMSKVEQSFEDWIDEIIK